MFVLRVRSHRSCRKSLISGSSVVEYHKGFYFVKLRIFTARRIAHSSNSDVNAISIGGPVPSRALLSIPFLSNPSPNIPPASAFWCTVVVKCMVTTDMVCCYAMQNKAGANLVAKTSSERIAEQFASPVHSLAFLPHDAIHSAAYAVVQCLFVCLSVGLRLSRLSHCIERSSILSNFFNRLVAPPLYTVRQKIAPLLLLQ